MVLNNGPNQEMEENHPGGKASDALTPIPGGIARPTQDEEEKTSKKSRGGREPGACGGGVGDWVAFINKFQTPSNAHVELYCLFD